MKAGAEQRKKTILAGALGAVALCCVIYMYNALFAGSSPAPAPVAPAPAVPVASKPAAPVVSNPPGTGSAANGSANGAPGLGLGVAPGVAAKKMASTSSSLDPSLDETAMLRTEGLVYSGTGRNIFSATYVPPVVIPKAAPPARPVAPVPVAVVPQGPPPPPPINLKFFGTATRANGQRQAFLLQGEDVYLASQGDVVARRYKIVSIGSNSIQVQDLTNSNMQSLPLQAN